MRFYLWGPTATGKTWLFDAFIRKVDLLNEALGRVQQPQFSLRVEDRMGMQQHRYTLDAIANTDIDYQEYTFYRDYLLGDENDRKRHACSHSHQFMMLDGPGDETTGEIAVTANTEENRARVFSAHEALKDSDYLMICVERGIRTLGQPDPTAPPSPQTQNVGQHYVERLRHLMNLARKTGQEIVICFTKSDMYGGRVAGFDAALRRLFGEYGHQIGDLLRELSGSRKEPPHFFVSAVGYYHNLQGRVAPNFNTGTNKLALPENWNPDAVEAPFFKILTDAELFTLRNVTLDRSGPFRGVGSKLVNESYRKDLVGAYVSYETMMKQVRVQAG